MKLFSSAVGEIIKFKNKDKPIVLRPALQYIKENIISKGMIGVEVGVQRGINAKAILQNLPIEKL